MRRDLTAGIVTLLVLGSLAGAAALTDGNLLVTHGDVLYEYTLGGSLVQSIPVPHPDTGRYTIGGAVVDRYGNVHAINYAPFDNDYISTWYPATDTWRHTPASIAFGNVSDGDIAIYGDHVYNRRLRMNVKTYAVETFQIDLGFGSVAETSVGRDGLLYSINSGSPRFRMRRTDPRTLTPVGPHFEVRDSGGSRLNGRGLAVTPDGEIYVADWDGRIYHFDKNATYIDEKYTGLNNQNSMDMRADGMLATGNRFGGVAITDVDFSTLSTFGVGSGNVYVAFIAPPVPEPTSMTLLLLGGLLLRPKRRRRSRPL